VKRLRALLVGLALVSCFPAFAENASPSVAISPRGIGVVPFYNLAGAPEATATIESEVVRRLERRGFAVTSGDPVRAHLRAHRIRARHELSKQQARALADVLGVRYLMVGTIDVWAQNGGPEIALSARILDPATGQTVWAGSAGLHTVEAPGLLALARPDTMEAAARKAVRGLFSSLSVKKRKDGGVVSPRARRKPRKGALAEAPIVFRHPAFDPKAPLRIAVLPLTNRTLSADAPGIINEQLLDWLMNAGNVEVIDPGELRQVLVENDIQPIYGMNRLQLRMIGRVLNADALLDGTVLMFEGGDTPVPGIDLFVRLRDTTTAETLWAATTMRTGNQFHTFYDIGRIQGVGRLTRVALGDLLSTLLR